MISGSLMTSTTPLGMSTISTDFHSAVTFHSKEAIPTRTAKLDAPKSWRPSAFAGPIGSITSLRLVIPRSWKSW